MLEQVSNFDQDIKFIIGFAGSGKSTRLAQLATPSTLILTPTHKAANVLKEKLSSLGKDTANIYTIYSVLKLVPHLDQDYNPNKNHKMQRLQQIGKTSLEDITDVFVDEYSMVNQSILDKLLDSLPLHAKVTVFGDAYQLPPVSGEPIEPEIYTDNIEELTTQHRADAPEVVETFMRFQQYIKHQDNSISLKLNPLIPKIDTIPSSGEYTFNPKTDRALAFTNSKVDEVNSHIAKTLNLPKEYSIGEELSANGILCNLSQDTPSLTIYPKCISKGVLITDEKIQLACQKIELDIVKYNSKYHTNYPKATVLIDGVEYTIYYDINHYETQKHLTAEVEKFQSLVYQHNTIPEDQTLTEWCKYNKNAMYVKERGKAWQHKIAHQSMVFNLQRPFATTIHKSQGSEFSTVFIAQDDIKKYTANKKKYIQYARLMYVALSRAIDRVIIIS